MGSQTTIVMAANVDVIKERYEFLSIQGWNSLSPLAKGSVGREKDRVGGKEI
jgi:hypothetical protein